MNKFKFGDLVFDEFLGVCVVLNVSEHFATIQNANGNFNSLANPDELKPVPHPDTARLDWLAASGGEIRRLDNGRWCIKHYVPARPVMGITETSGYTLRTVIDAAMKLSE